jgi:hypothetical protein
MSGIVQVFGCRQTQDHSRAREAGVRKAPRHEIAVRRAPDGGGPRSTRLSLFIRAFRNRWPSTRHRREHPELPWVPSMAAASPFSSIKLTLRCTMRRGGARAACGSSSREWSMRRQPVHYGSHCLS